jgi:hypothetical protein
VAVVIEKDDPYEGTGFVRPLALESSKTFRTSLSPNLALQANPHFLTKRTGELDRVLVTIELVVCEPVGELVISDIGSSL